MWSVKCELCFMCWAHVWGSHASKWCLCSLISDCVCVRAVTRCFACCTQIIWCPKCQTANYLWCSGDGFWHFQSSHFLCDCELVILAIWIQGSGTHGDRQCCKHVLSWKSKMAWDVSERSLSLEAVLVYTFALMVILILFCLSFGWNPGRDLWGVLAMSQNQIMQVMLVAFCYKVCWS